MRAIVCRACAVTLLWSVPAMAAAQSAPHDLWTSAVLATIRDVSTLRLELIPRDGYFELFYDSEAGDAKWADAEPPYAIHRGQTIRIHAYLAVPRADGPRPAIVIGHGHGGHGDSATAMAVAALGYVALSFDGPGQGQSTGPRDTEQAWISVEEQQNSPAPEVSYQYHWAYAGMRALTVLEALASIPMNPLRIDSGKLAIAGASMGGQLTYYVNGVDDRVKAAVAIAVSGDWRKMLRYEGAWLYHGLYYYTRDGLRSGIDALNAIASCDDPTLQTFLDYFDPIAYAPTQHGPVLTIVGTHDQYFVVPGINTTFDAVRSAGSVDRFRKRIYLAPNAKHGVVDGPDAVNTILELLPTIDRWLKFAFDDGLPPPRTPAVAMGVLGPWMIFRVRSRPGITPVSRAELDVASQMDSTRPLACDFARVPLVRQGDDFFGVVPIGQPMWCGPPLTPANVLYFGSVSDGNGATVSSKLHYGFGELTFDSGFEPRIEHWRGDTFPAPPPICR